MKVFVVDQFSHIGGGQLCLLDLLPAFHGHGWQVHAAIPSSGAFADRLLASGVIVDFFGGRSYRPSRKSLLDMMRFPVDICRQATDFARLARRDKPDLVYVNGPRVLPAAALAAGATPLVFHAHNHVSQQLAQAIVTSCIRTRAASVIACSQSVGDGLKSHVPTGKLTVVLNGVEDHGYRERFRNPLISPRVGIVGSIAAGKGHALFLGGAKLLTARMPGVRFIVCGSLSEADKRYAESLLEMSRGLPVEWLGWREDMAQVLKDLDLLVISSAMEGFPRVMLEAFSAGVPVVAFPAGGIPEAIRDGETGFLVEQQTAEALAEKLANVLNAKAVLQQVARNAREAWEQNYNVKRYRTDVMAVVDRIAHQ